MHPQRLTSPCQLTAQNQNDSRQSGFDTTSQHSPKHSRKLQFTGGLFGLILFLFLFDLIVLLLICLVLILFAAFVSHRISPYWQTNLTTEITKSINHYAL